LHGIAGGLRCGGLGRCRGSSGRHGRPLGLYLPGGEGSRGLSKSCSWVLTFSQLRDGDCRLCRGAGGDGVIGGGDKATHRRPGGLWSNSLFHLATFSLSVMHRLRLGGVLGTGKESAPCGGAGVEVGALGLFFTDSGGCFSVGTANTVRGKAAMVSIRAGRSLTGEQPSRNFRPRRTSDRN